MLARRSAIEAAIDTDFGYRSRHETAMMEILGVVQGIDYLARNLRRFMRPTGRHIALDMQFGSNRVAYQPLGVAGIISPWNYPVSQPERVGVRKWPTASESSALRQVSPNELASGSGRAVTCRAPVRDAGVLR
jgi:hypothetical protein